MDFLGFGCGFEWISWILSGFTWIGVDFMEYKTKMVLIVWTKRSELSVDLEL